MLRDSKRDNPLRRYAPAVSLRSVKLAIVVRESPSFAHYSLRSDSFVIVVLLH